MDENQTGVKEEEETPEVESPTTEESTEEVEEPTEEEASEPEEEETETVSEGKGANQRIRELNQKAKAAEARAQSLEERIAELTGSVEPTGGFTPPTQAPQPIVRPGEELTAEELDRRIQEREQRLLSQIDSRQELSRRQDEAVARHRNETSEVANLYPQLNPNSDQFDPELSEAVTEAVEAQLKASPYTASVKKIVEKQMKPYLRSVANEVGKERENIAKQVSQSALRPTSVRKSEKTTSEKSIAELEAELGIIQS